MKIGFIFDIRFPYYQGEYYAVDMPARLWQEKYLTFCQAFKVVGRKEVLSEAPSSNLSVSSTNNVEFDCVDDEPPFQRLVHKKSHSKHIRAAIADCDFVICRGFWGVRECIAAKKPYMIEVVGCQWDGLWNHSWKGKLVALPRFLAMRKAVRNAPYVLYVTNEFLQRRYLTKGVNIGVSDVRLEPLDDSAVQRRLERISNRQANDKIIIGTTAAVNVKYKGQQYVIKALAELKKSGLTNYEYQLVGAGDSSFLEKTARECGVSDQVVFKGPMLHADVFNWLDTLDAYVQPSLQEGLPRAVVEAMSRGCPVFGSNTGGTPELLNRDLVVKRKNVHDIAEKLRMLNKATLSSEAVRSFTKAKEYDADVLKSRRDEFMNRWLSQA